MIKKICFVTGNPNKLTELKEGIPLGGPELIQLDLDLAEIQDCDPRKVIEAKLLEAARMSSANAILVEDTSLSLNALNGLPGPLVKWFPSQGLVDLTKNDSGATAIVWLGLLLRQENYPQIGLYFFSGETKGNIVPPSGSGGFGWDDIFQPEGSSLTFAKMPKEKKAKFSVKLPPLT